MDNAINSLAFLRPHWFCWKVLGITTDKVKLKVPYIVYSIILNFLVTFGNPFHLSMFLFRSETLSNNLQNLAISVTTVACSIKFVIYAIKFRRIYEIERLLKELDKRVLGDDERAYFLKIRRQLRTILLTYLVIYFPVGITGELSFIFREGRTLLYVAWFPFNWHDSDLNYVIANVYQVVSLFYQLMQNYVDDCFPTVILCLICGHIQMLEMRVSKIGFDKNDSIVENEEELARCIRDQKNLYCLFETLHELMSWPMFIQFALTAFNMCVAMAALIFFVDALWDRIYYFVYFVAMPTQIFPACYYGTELEALFGRLPYAVFSSNWMDQSHKYKKHMMLFAERSLKQTTALAGGMVRVHVDTFFGTCKGAYSLFAVIMRLK